MNFQTKQIYNSEMVGARLRALREERQVSLESLAAGTKIQKKYLEALETDKFETLGNPIYAQNFIKAYARFLGVPHQPLLQNFKDHRDEPAPNNKVFVGESKFSRRFSVSYKFFRNLGFILVALALLAYLGLAVRNILMPPAVAVSFPPNNYVALSQQVELTGKVATEARLKINGQEIYTDDAGNFKEKIDLSDGLNVIKLAAQKKHSEETVIYWRIFFGSGQVSIR